MSRAAALLRGAGAYFETLGVPIQRVLTDNGKAFYSAAFAEACLERGIAQKFTRANRPQNNGKAGRFIQFALREWAYGRVYANSAQHSQALPVWTHFYNWHRQHHDIQLIVPVSRLVAVRKNLLTLHSYALAAERPALKAPPEHRPFRVGDVQHSRADIGKAGQRLGYLPSHDIVGGLAVAARWYVGQV